MPISDLTGTKWVLNSSLTIEEMSGLTNNSATINFTSAGIPYQQMYLNHSDFYLYYYLIAGNTGTRSKVYDDGTWSSQADRIIEITGGTDATNAGLISWLQSNATQVEATDLAGTNWTFHPKGLKTGVFGSSSTTRQYVNISYSATASTYEFTNQTAIYLTSYEFTQSGYPVVGNAISLAPGDLNAQAYYWKQQDAFSDDQYTWVKVRDNGTIVNLGDENVTISFTSGTDCTNPDLILWFSQNATYQAPQPQATPDISIGSLPLSAVFFGTQEVTKIYLGNTLLYEAEIIPDNAILDSNGNYILASDGWLLTTPSYSITATVTNGTSSGDSTIAGNGTASVTISPSSGYDLPSSVTVSGASYTYDSTTGVVSLSSPSGNVTISGTCEQQPSAGSFTIQFTNDCNNGTITYNGNDISTDYSTSQQISVVSGETLTVKSFQYLAGQLRGTVTLNGTEVQSTKTSSKGKYKTTFTCVPQANDVVEISIEIQM